MCGIVGFSSDIPYIRAIKVRFITRMMGALAHRGPDQGAYVETSPSTMLGHVRMRVRGSHDITQPFRLGGTDPLWCSVNGEFYNRIGWRHTDSELCLLPPESLIGEFAFAVYNTRLDQTVLVRDKFGVKPMYYYWYQGFYAFASEGKALVMHPEVDNTEDPNAACRMFVNMVVPNTTLWKNIKAVPPGCTVTLRKDKPPEIKQYWDVPVDQEQKPLDLTTLTRIRDELKEAVYVRTYDTKVACYVSNGMDGQIINNFCTTDTPTITSKFGDGDHYDRATVTLEEFNPTKMMPECAYQAERTIYNPIGVAKWEMAKVAKSMGYNAIISGQGADELFAGYQFFNFEPWAGLSSSGIISHGNHTEQPMHDAWEEIFGFTPQFLHPWLRLWKSSIFYETRDKYDPFAEVAQMFKDKVYLDHLTLQQYLWIKTHFVDQILTWGGDRPEMAHAIEGRVPYLDLVDVAFSIKPQDRRNKKPLREAFSHYPFTQTPKRSFMYPYKTDAIWPDSYTTYKEEYRSKYVMKKIEGPLADTAHWQTVTLNALTRLRNLRFNLA